MLPTLVPFVSLPQQGTTVRVIDAKNACKKAAEALGLRNPTTTYTGLWFNPEQSSSANGAKHDDLSLYSTQAGLHKIASFDGTALTADSETPAPTAAGEKFPLVIFINSWGMPQIEYVVKTLQWAQEGYICLEYQARGWFLSGGEIGTAGPDDIKDVSAVIDWALKTWPQADPSRIAVAGISYGGGIALLSAAHDARVRSVLALSGWSNIYQALNWHDSPSVIWGNLLVLLGKVVGKEPAILSDMLGYVLSHKNMTFVKEWAAQRSAVTYLDAINKNNPA
eukprot:gene21863-42483_t